MHMRRNLVNKGKVCSCGHPARIKNQCINCYQRERSRMEKTTA